MGIMFMGPYENQNSGDVLGSPESLNQGLSDYMGPVKISRLVFELRGETHLTRYGHVMMTKHLACGKVLLVGKPALSFSSNPPSDREKLQPPFPLVH
jgi:hypothetical protein